MRQSKFTDEQITTILAELNSGELLKDVCRKHNVSDKTIYKWKQRFGSMQISDVKKMKELLEENSKLKRLVANQALDIFTKRRDRIRIIGAGFWRAGRKLYEKERKNKRSE